MALEFKVAIDARDPLALGEFWQLALGYVRHPPPPGFDDWESALATWGKPPSTFNDVNSIIDPEGAGPPIVLQKVPESKAVKNRLHLDVNVGGQQAGRPDRVRAHVATLVAAGARVIREHEEDGTFWMVLQDPEGNEFCVH